VWARGWLSKTAPKVARYGTLRLVRDVLGVSGRVEMNVQTGALVRVTLNRFAPLPRGLLDALRNLLLPQHVALTLGET